MTNYQPALSYERLQELSDYWCFRGQRDTVVDGATLDLLAQDLSHPRNIGLATMTFRITTIAHSLGRDEIKQELEDGLARLVRSYAADARFPHYRRRPVLVSA